MREGIVGQSCHSEEALYNILAAALSKYEEAQRILTVVSSIVAVLPSE
jgi:hypothetical protein